MGRHLSYFCTEVLYGGRPRELNGRPGFFWMEQLLLEPYH